MNYEKQLLTALDYQKAVQIFAEEMGFNKAKAKREFDKLFEAGQLSFTGEGGFPVQPEEFVERVRALK